MGSVLFGGFALQTAGIRFTSPSKAAFITGFSVVLVPMLLAVWGHTRVQVRVWVGALTALAGLYYLAVPSAREFSRLNRGDLLVLCAAVLFAVHIIAVGTYTTRHSPAALSLVQVVMMALLAAIAVPVFAITGWQTARVHWTPGLAGAVLATGVLATAVAFSAQVWAQQHASSSHTAILFSLEPVFAAITVVRIPARTLGSSRAGRGGADPGGHPACRTARIRRACGSRIARGARQLVMNGR